MIKYLGHIVLIMIVSVSCSEKQAETDTIEGTWRCSESHPLMGQRSYLVEIEQSQSDTTKYLISNFYNLDYNEFVFAYLSGADLTIPQQVVMTLIVKSGSGKVSDDMLSVQLVYNVIDETNDIRVTALLTRP